MTYVIRKRSKKNNSDWIYLSVIAVGLGLFLWSPAKVNEKVQDVVDTVEQTVEKKEVSASRQAFINAANNWVGMDYEPGSSEECARFVRYVLSEIGVTVGVTEKPFDKTLPTNEAIANSFFGEDLGTLKYEIKDLQPGDLVAFHGTYGEWIGTKVITHVGIVVEISADGSDAIMVDRPTKNKPVQKRSVTEFGNFSVGISLNEIK